MAFTTQLYHQAALYLGQGAFGPGSTELSISLHGSGASFDPAHTSTGSVTDEFSGNGWPSYGVTLTGLSWTRVDTNEAKLQCDAISVTATGGPITATYGLVYQNFDNRPLIWIDFDGEKTAADTYDFILSWGSGLLIVAP